MKNSSILSAFVYAVVCLLPGCAANTAAPVAAAPTPPPVPATHSQTGMDVTYTTQEMTHLELCVSLAENARTIAQDKLNGMSADAAKSQFTGTGKLQNVLVSTVDKVYHDPVTNAWDYGVAFFKECTFNLAGVAPVRGDRATYCFMNTMIAETAWEARAAGKPKEAVYQTFSGLHSATPDQIIDSIYAPPALPAKGVEQETFKGCVNPAR